MLYQKALRTAMFLELDDVQSQELFGDGGYREDGEAKTLGMFNASKVEKATLEACIKRNHSIHKLTYREVMGMWQKKRT